MYSEDVSIGDGDAFGGDGVDGGGFLGVGDGDSDGGVGDSGVSDDIADGDGVGDGVSVGHVDVID